MGSRTTGAAAAGLAANWQYSGGEYLPEASASMTIGLIHRTTKMVASQGRVVSTRNFFFVFQIAATGQQQHDRPFEHMSCDDEEQ